MSNKTRSSLKIFSLILFVIWVLMVQGILSMPVLSPYTFWMILVSYVLLLVAAR